MRDRSIAIWVAAFVCACGPTSHSNNGGDDDGDVDANTGGGGGGGGGGGNVDALGCSKMDLLFVIDNSGSMQQEQTNLIANFPTFISVLDASGLDYRVAVTTTPPTAWSPFSAISNSHLIDGTPVMTTR